MEGEGRGKAAKGKGVRRDRSVHESVGERWCLPAYLRFGPLRSGFRLLRGRESDAQSQCLMVVLRLLQTRVSLEGLANVAPGNRGAPLNVGRTKRHAVQK